MPNISKADLLELQQQIEALQTENDKLLDLGTDLSKAITNAQYFVNAWVKKTPHMTIAVENFDEFIRAKCTECGKPK